jgi:hypothetical protein
MLEWAQAHLAALKEVTEALVKSQHYPAVTEFDANTGEHVVRLGTVPELPPEIAARVGDVLFNPRCSLDHLVYALSKRPGTCKGSRCQPGYEAASRWRIRTSRRAAHLATLLTGAGGGNRWPRKLLHPLDMGLTRWR